MYKPRKYTGHLMNHAGTLAPKFMETRSRAKRRNLARKNKELHAWKLPRNHVKISNNKKLLLNKNEQTYVPYPLVSTRHTQKELSL